MQIIHSARLSGGDEISLKSKKRTEDRGAEKQMRVSEHGAVSEASLIKNEVYEHNR